MPGKRDSLPEKSLRFSKVTDAGLKELAGLTTATSNGVQVMGANCSKGTSAARVGRLDRRAQVNLRNLLRSDTPKWFFKRNNSPLVGVGTG
jgi:hypothetical protein